MANLNQIAASPGILERFLAPPTFPDDVAKTRMAHLLATFLLLAFALTLLYSVIWAIIMPGYIDRLIFAPVGLAGLFIPAALLRAGRVRFASFAFLGGAWLFITVVAINSGGTRAPFFNLYTLLVMAAVLLGGWRFGLGIAIPVVLAGLGMVILDQMGMVAPPIATPLSSWVTQITTMSLLAATVYTLVRQSAEAIAGGRYEVAERQKAEAALRESEARFRLISSITSDYTFSSYFNAQGGLEHVMLTGAFEKITGYTPEEYIAMGGWRATVHPDDRLQDDLDLATLRKNEPVTSELRTVKKGGEVCWVRVYAHPIWDAEQNRLTGINGAVQDISERKLTEQALRDSEIRYRIVGAMISNYAFAYDIHPDGSFTFAWNTDHSFQRLTGYHWDEIGASFKLYHPDDEDRVRQDVDLTIHGQATSGEYRIVTKDGAIRWVYIHRHVEWDEAEGRYVRFFGAAQDITERKVAEEWLLHSEAMLRALLDATTDVAFLMSPDGILLTVNKAMAESMRLPIEAMVGQNGFELLKPEVSKERVARIEAVIETMHPMRWEDVGLSGWWDNSVYPVLSPTGEVEALAVYSRDITEQRRLAAELQRYTTQLEQMVQERTIQLQRAKEQIEVILNNTSHGVALAQRNGDIMTRNPEFMAVFGDRVSDTLEHILWTVVNDDQVVPLTQALVQVIYEQKRQHVVAQVVSDDGKEKDIDLVFIPVQSAEEDGHQEILVSAHDITHVKEIERFKARFVANALHDLATPITGLSTRLYMLKRSPDNLAEHVRALENQVHHLSALLGELRTLSQLDRGQLALNFEPCNLYEIARRVYDTYEPVALNKQQTLQLVCEAALPEIRIDSRQIERVLVNLVSNAIYYSPNGKPISIVLVTDDESVGFSVQDEGMGIDPQALPQIFERFFRTDSARKRQADGTGLGLAIVKEIVELHGGTVTAESRLGEGSTFTIRLPREQR